MTWSIMQNKLGLGSILISNAVSIVTSIGSQNNSDTPCSLATLEEFGCQEGGVFAYDVIKNMIMQIMINFPKIWICPIRPYNVSLYRI